MKVEKKQILNYKFLLVDLDNTLYQYDICHNFALSIIYKILKRAVNYASMADFLADYKQSQILVKKYTAKTAASHSRFLYFQNLVERKLGKTDVEMVIKLEKQYWKSFFSKMKINKNIVDLLWKAKKNGSKICIVTNLASAIQFGKIRKLKFEKLIDYIVTSEEAGIEKPDISIFEKALNKMGADKKSTLVIGDELIDDVSAAEKLRVDYFLCQYY